MPNPPVGCALSCPTVGGSRGQVATYAVGDHQQPPHPSHQPPVKAGIMAPALPINSQKGFLIVHGLMRILVHLDRDCVCGPVGDALMKRADHQYMTAWA